MSVPVDVMNRMSLEIVLGIPWGDERSRIEQTDENREMWEGMEEDIARIKADGMVVALPVDTEVF
jgi:hypothetical protein